MKKILSDIGKIIAWIIFIGVFASIGLATENPSVMVPVYGIAIIVILGTILFFLVRKKRQSFEATATKTPVFIPMTGGILLLLFSFVFPAYAISRFLPIFVTVGSSILFTLLLIALGFLGVWLINVLSQKIKALAWLGYILIIVAAAVPALAIASIDASAETLGVLYFVVMVEAILVWAGYSMFFSKIKGRDE